MEVNFCRRCGATLTQDNNHVFKCSNGHTIYANSSPAVGAILSNSKGEVLTIRRSVEPGLGELDFPGGFCDDHETGEGALARELEEEVGLSTTDYTKPVFLLTGLDDYQFGGEDTPVLSLIFTAKLKDGAQITAGDDAEQPEFIPLSDINPDEVYFDALKKAVSVLQQGGLQ